MPFKAGRAARCSRCRGPFDHDRKYNYCRACSSALKREYNLKPSAKLKATQNYRSRRYGVTPAEFERMKQEQGGVCGACRQPETSVRRGIARALCVDHDHATGRVRGLLCSRCNTALGLLGDNENRIQGLLSYLSAPRGAYEVAA